MPVRGVFEKYLKTQPSSPSNPIGKKNPIKLNVRKMALLPSLPLLQSVNPTKNNKSPMSSFENSKQMNAQLKVLKTIYSTQGLLNDQS